MCSEDKEGARAFPKPGITLCDPWPEELSACAPWGFLCCEDLPRAVQALVQPGLCGDASGRVCAGAGPGVSLLRVPVNAGRGRRFSEETVVCLERELTSLGMCALVPAASPGWVVSHRQGCWPWFRTAQLGTWDGAGPGGRPPPAAPRLAHTVLRAPLFQMAQTLRPPCPRPWPCGPGHRGERSRSAPFRTRGPCLE